MIIFAAARDATVNTYIPIVDNNIPSTNARVPSIFLPTCQKQKSVRKYYGGTWSSGLDDIKKQRRSLVS